MFKKREISRAVAGIIALNAAIAIAQDENTGQVMEEGINECLDALEKKQRIEKALST